MKLLILCALVLSSSILSSSAWAWGRRGHETVASIAAQLLAKENPKTNKILQEHSYDLGYYANVPDFVWKSTPELYKKEHGQHFIDLEHFEKDFEKNKTAAKWDKDRSKFFAAHPDLKPDSGRAPWRIQELSDKLLVLAQKLRDKKVNAKDHQKLQADWLLHAGVLGHYVGDLAQPLHVTEDYDARNVGQGGLHGWFEDDVVDDLYPHIAAEVLKRAQSRWSEFKKANAGKEPFELAMDLAADSRKAIPELLKIDKAQGRAKLSKSAEAYKEMVIERISQGVLRLALIWSKSVDWPYDGHKFYIWQGTPEYIEPAVEKIESK